MTSWMSGQEWDVGGVEVRVVKGHKGPDDLRLEIRAMEFVPVKMALGFIFADFYKRNEDVLYPKSEGRLGGQLYLNFIRCAMQVGWQTAERMLKAQRAKKRAA